MEVIKFEHFTAVQPAYEFRHEDNGPTRSSDAAVHRWIVGKRFWSY